VLSRRGNQVLVRWPAPIAQRGELVRLELIHGHCQLALVALHRCHGHNHVVDDGADVSQLFLGGLSCGGRWCRHGGNGGGSKDGEQWWWWGLVVGCAAAAAVEKFGSEYQDVVAWAIRPKSKVTPSQLGQDQFLLALFIDSSTLYSRLIQSRV
jgi:hypothetical protein